MFPAIAPNRPDYLSKNGNATRASQGRLPFPASRECESVTLPRLRRKVAWGGLRGRQERDRSTGFLNRCNCRFGCAMDGKLQRHLDFAPAEQTDAVLGAPQHPAPDQG